jgi:hypothetical protein
MRTTLTLEDALYESARKLAFEQRRPLGDIVSELAQRGLDALETPKRQRTLGFWQGRGWIAEDFNDTPQEVAASIESDL